MITLIPMTKAQYKAYENEAIRTYAEEKVASGQWSQAESHELSKKSMEELLPQGLSTPNNFLFTVQDSDAGAVGMLWFAAVERGGQLVAYVYDVSIKTEHQRQGFATAAFRAMEEKARELSLSGIALHVFGHNTAAQALYQKLDYQTTNINMYKPIAP